MLPRLLRGAGETIVFWRKRPAPVVVPEPSHEFERLHEQAVNRRYDLRVCNPAHGGFYALMERYKLVADDPAQLDSLAEEIAMRRTRMTHDDILGASFEQLAQLALWRARYLRTTKL